MSKRLVKSRDKKLYGVAGGLAVYFDIDPVLVRVGFVVLCICFLFLGLIAYIALAIMMPPPDDELSLEDVPSFDTSPEDPGGQSGSRRKLLG